jgi:5-methyltetrahydropteroyltriglutamate--homocysteine methyltransferase
MRTTHVGSLVRPDDLVAFLRKRDASEAYDEQACQECRARSVREVVAPARGRGRRRPGRRVRQVGVNSYVYERLGGSELRPHIQRVHPSIQWAKLRSLSEGAKLAAGALAV